MAMPRIPLPLRSKLAIAFVLVLAPVLGLMVHDHLADARRNEEAVLEGQLRTARAVGTMVEAIFEQGVAIGQTIAIDPTIQTLDPSRVDPFLARYLPLYPKFDALAVYDASGQNVGASRTLPSTEPRPNISDRDYFQRAMSTGEASISGVIVGRVTGRRTAVAGVPFQDATGQTLGIVVVPLDLSTLPMGLQTLELQPGRMIWVADPNGLIAFDTLRPEQMLPATDVSGHPPVADALANGEFAGTVPVGMSGEPRLVAAARTPRHGWAAGVSTDLSLVREGTRQAMLDSLTIYLGIVLVAGLLAAGLTYAITRPLGDLSRTIAAFGRGDLGQRARVRTGDELETTAGAFNRMASDLQREQDWLRFLNDFGAELTSSLDVEQVVQLLARRSTETLGEASWVCLLSGQEEPLCRLMASHSREPSMLQQLCEVGQRHEHWMNATLFLPVARSGEPILIEDLASFELEGDLHRELLQMNATSLMVVPLQARGHPVGLLASVGLSPERRLGRNELTLAMVLANRAAMAIDNALLFQKVREDERRLQTILDTVPVGVVVADAPLGRVTMANRMVETILRRRPDPGADARQWDQNELYRLSGEAYPAGESPLARTLSGGDVLMGEEVMVRLPSGREICVLMHTAPLRDGEGRVTGGVVALQDITPLKEAQWRVEELAQKAERHRADLDAVIEAVGEGITIADGEGRVVTVNRRGRAILGVVPAPGTSLDQFTGKIELCYPDGRPLLHEQWPIVRAVRGELFSGEEAILRRPDGSSSNLLFSSGVVRGESGRVRLAISIYRDITPIREMERAREEFISVIAHDLRSPLTVISGFAGILQRIPVEQRGRQQEQRALDSILTSARRLERMVADLLDASRIEARRLVLSKEPVDLPRLVHEVADRSVELMREHQLRIEVHGVVPAVEADPARLEQVLVNLISNAAKYSFANTEILLEVERRPEDVVVSVTNQGHGIPPEELESIFERFRRTRATTTGTVPGLGLGLYITKGLVEAHGGRIWVESEPDRCTAFRFALPLGSVTSGQDADLAA